MEEISLVTPALKKMVTVSNDICFDEESSLRFLSMLRTEDKIRVKLTAAVSKIVDPVLIDVATTFCAPLLANIVVPTSQAFLESINGFNSDMQHFLVNHSETFTDDQKLLCELDCAHRRVSHLSGSFMSSRQILWDMYTTNCSNLLNSSANNGLGAYDLYCEISDSIRKLLHNAIHHFGVLIQKGVPGIDNAQGVLSQVCLMMRAGACVANSFLLKFNSQRSYLFFVQYFLMMSPDAKMIQRNVLGLLLNR